MPTTSDIHPRHTYDHLGLDWDRRRVAVGKKKNTPRRHRQGVDRFFFLSAIVERSRVGGNQVQVTSASVFLFFLFSLYRDILIDLDRFQEFYPGDERAKSGRTAIERWIGERSRIDKLVTAFSESKERPAKKKMVKV